MLESQGLFVVPRDDRGAWYRYHHLFQDLLRVELEAKASDSELSALHRTAALWLDRNASLEEALPHYVCGAKAAVVEEAVVRHCREMEKHEQWHRLAHCLQLVPAEVEEESVDLQIIAAFCADKRGRYGEMMQALDRAEEVLAKSAVQNRVHDIRRGRVEMMRAGLLAHHAQGAQALERAQRAVRWLPDEASGDRSYALLMVACGFQMTGDLARARLVLGEESERRSRDSAAYQAHLLGGRYLVEWMSADLPKLRRCATAGLGLGQKNELEETVIWSRFFLAAVHYHWGELQEAETVLQPLVANRFGPGFQMHVTAVEVSALCEQALGRPDRARELVSSLAEFLLEVGNESYREYVEAIQAELDLRQGRRAKAPRWATEYRAGELWAGYHFSVPELSAAKMLLLEGDEDGVERAGRMLEELHTFFSSSHNHLFLIPTLALQAIFFEAGGRRDEAVERLGEAIKLARPSGILRLFVDLGPEAWNTWVGFCRC